MGILDAVVIMRAAISSLDVKATKENCSNLTALHFWLDKIEESCNNSVKTKEGELNDGKGEREDV